jgi:hypothetical protein
MVSPTAPLERLRLVAGDFTADPAGLPLAFFGGIAENLPHFLLQAPTMPLGAVLQRFLTTPQPARKKPAGRGRRVRSIER